MTLLREKVFFAKEGYLILEDLLLPQELAAAREQIFPLNRGALRCMPISRQMSVTFPAQTHRPTSEKRWMVVADTAFLSLLDSMAREP